LALGSRLPEDISVLEAWEAPDSFHPRYDAKGKEYVYRIRNSRVKDPFTAATTCLWQKPIDDTLCDALCKQFVGNRDFRSFMAAGSDITDTVREVYDFSCKREGDTVLFTVSANGFLYNMVRILVGTVLDLHDGVLKGTPQTILDALDRSAAGRTMPPGGLCLEKVFY
jgi:tRNA pseudouridine38-40 synthase